MVTLAQRIEALRTEANLSRSALAAALGFPQGAFDKFEMGRATPTKGQQEQLAAYFGVSLFYLRGESGDRTRQEMWMDGPPAGDPTVTSRHKPVEVYTPPREEQPTVWDTLLAGKQTQTLLRTLVLDVLRSPEGQAIIAKAAAKEKSV